MISAYAKAAIIQNNDYANIAEWAISFSTPGL